MASKFEGMREPLGSSHPIFPHNLYFVQVWYDWKLKKFFEYVECGEGSIDINNDPINGFWEEIDWDYKRLP